jgi:hypothetical protein
MGSKVILTGGDLPVWETGRGPTELYRLLPFHCVMESGGLLVLQDVREHEQDGVRVTPRGHGA